MPKHNSPATPKKATRKPRVRKCSRPELLPYPEYPLFPHGSGRWAKKIRNRLHYFGKIEDWKGALAKYEREIDDLQAGRKPRPVEAAGLTIGALANKFLEFKRARVDSGELSPRTFLNYYESAKATVDFFKAARLIDDLRPDDFERLRSHLGAGRSLRTLTNRIINVRVMFRYAFKAELIDRPARFGQSFDAPSQPAIDREDEEKGARMFEAAELRRIIKAAGVPLRAMILLGINCGYGNNDVGLLPLSALDLKSGWVEFKRPKTGARRRCWLWPETVEAIQRAIAERPDPKGADVAKLVFVTRCGEGWSKERDELPDADVLAKKKSMATFSPVSGEFRKVLHKLGLHSRGRAFYALRHTFATVASEGPNDSRSINWIMGHVDRSMAEHYRERPPSDDRLSAVAAYVRTWMLTADRGGEKEPEGGWTLE